MLKFKLDNHFKEPTYPKKNVHRALFYDAQKRCYKEIWCEDDIYKNRSFYNCLIGDCIKEMNNVRNEEQPCKVMLANMGMLFWAFKGPGYNYGGFKNLTHNSVNKIQYNKNYVTESVYRYCDYLRGEMEVYADLLPELKNAADSQLYPAVESLYYKLLLLLYDLMIGATVFFTAGDIYSYNEGVEARSDGLGGVYFSDTTKYADDRSLEVKTANEIFGAEKFGAYCQLRPEIANEVKRLCPSYPAENNTWHYFRVDINELNAVVREIYGINLPDLTDEQKRDNMKMHSKLVGDVNEFYKGAIEITYGMIPIVGKHIRKGLEKGGTGEYTLGRVRKEEQYLRQTISLFK